MALICNHLDHLVPKIAGIRWKPICGQQIRNKIISLRTPQLPPWDKKLMLATCEPILKKDTDLPTSLTCANITDQKETEIHPYIQILADEYKEYLSRSPLLGVYHLNPIDDLNYRTARNAMIKKGFIMQNYARNVAELALKSTKFEPLLNFYTRSVTTIIAFGESISVQPLFDLEKNAPFLILLFGVCQDRILRRDELLEMSKLPSIEVLHQQLSYTLSSFGSSIVSNLDHHGQQLTSALGSYSKSNSNSES